MPKLKLRAGRWESSFFARQTTFENRTRRVPLRWIGFSRIQPTRGEEHQEFEQELETAQWLSKVRVKSFRQTPLFRERRERPHHGFRADFARVDGSTTHIRANGSTRDFLARFRREELYLRRARGPVRRTYRDKSTVLPIFIQFLRKNRPSHDRLSRRRIG